MKMNKHDSFRRIIFLVALSLLSPLLFYSSDAWAISVEKEKEAGREAALYGKYTEAVLDNGFAKQYFNELGQYLATPVETKHFKFNFFVINNKDVNAFATFAGNIFFFSGLINMVDSLDELGAVLCHEISHVSARHISKGMQRQNKIMIAQIAGLLAGALLGGDAAAPLIVGSQAIGKQAMINFTRDNERQADQLGFKYMIIAGLDPKEMITLFKKFNQIKRMSPYVDKIPTYLQTHPLDSERMSNADSMMKGYTPGEPGEEVMRFRKLFPFFQAVIRAKTLDPHDAEKIFLRELEKDPESISSHYGLGIAYTKDQDIDKAIFHLEKALKAKPDFDPILTSLGKAYQGKGEDKKAISIFTKAMALNEEDNSIPFHIGISHENMEQYDEAIRYFKKLTYYKPVESGVYYHLGLSYGRQNKLVLAHYNFGVYYKRWRSIEKARFHFQKAFKLAKGDPEMREKIRKEQEDLRKNFPMRRNKG